MKRLIPRSLGAAAIALGLVAATHASADQPTLNIYNWSDYIAPDTIPNFEKMTGIKVNYDTYDSNETLDAKLKAGNSGYDIVVPTLTPFLANQIKAGIYQPLDKSKLPNYGHLNKSILAKMALSDPGNTYAIPWMTGTDGVGYNVDQVHKIMPDAPVDSLKIIFDPDIVSKFKDCGVEMLDSPTDVLPAALAYLGLNPNSQKLADLKKAQELMEKIRPYVRKFDSSEYINDLANGDVCLTWGYSTDINQARRRADDAKKGVHVKYQIPKEGTQRWIDTVAIPKDAPHPELALKYMNYILDPQVIAKTANFVYIQSGNGDATKYMDPSIVNDPNIIPPPSVEAKLYPILVTTPKFDRARTRAWTTIKTGQ